MKIYKISKNVFIKYKDIIKEKLKIGNASVLFEGDDYLFKRIVTEKGICYGEYGLGKSTVWMSYNFRGPIISVDSSVTWFNRVNILINRNKSILSKWVDLGDVGDWGRPLSYDQHTKFNEYTDWIWSHDQKPNVILIDGRFRVCCFFTCLLNTQPGDYIFFDDYVDRKHYHYVENFLKPIQYCGRQAVFKISEKLDAQMRKSIMVEINKFRYVME